MSLPQLIQGHTPHDRLAYLLGKLSEELEGESAAKIESLAEARSLAKQAKELIDKYDHYVARMSSPAPDIVNKMVDETYKHDWLQIHQAGHTQYRLIPEMSAGPYEAVVLQQIARLSKVSFWPFEILSWLMGRCEGSEGTRNRHVYGNDYSGSCYGAHG
jgi:hypothetical protein